MLKCCYTVILMRELVLNVKYKQIFTALACSFVLSSSVFLEPVLATPKDDIVATTDDIDSVNDDIAQLDSKISNNVVALEKQQRKLSRNKAKLHKLNVQIDDLKVNVKSLKHQQKKSLLALQKQSNQSASGNIYVDYVLAGTSLDDVVGRVMAVSTIAKYRNDQHHQLKIVLADLDVKMSKQDALTDKIADDLAALKVDEKSLAKQKEQAKTALKRLQAKLKTQQSVVQSMSAMKMPVLISSDEQAVLQKAESQSMFVKDVAKYLGTPYVWGGATPDGFDCSGLMIYAAHEIGVRLPRVSQDQSRLGTLVKFDKLEVGDLLFWGSVGTAHHVAVYIGDGLYIHAPQPGDHVKIGRFDWFTPDFAKHISTLSQKVTK